MLCHIAIFLTLQAMQLVSDPNQTWTEYQDGCHPLVQYRAWAHDHRTDGILIVALGRWKMRLIIPEREDGQFRIVWTEGEPVAYLTESALLGSGIEHLFHDQAVDVEVVPREESI